MQVLVANIDAPDEPIIVRSPAMREVQDLVAKIAPSDVPVLIRGELGVGKRQVAWAVHQQSRRAAGPFIYVNPAAIHEAELDTKLFGRQQDFGGEEQVGRGFLESARGGTIYLANVQCLPLWAQVRLFDAFQRGGCGAPANCRAAPLDVRVIASITVDLEAAMAEGRFYDKLYYFFSTLCIHVPALRERQQDIKALAERCLARMVAWQGSATGGEYRFTQEAWQWLLNYEWPGNLPELASLVARAVALADGKEIGKEAIARSSHSACPGNVETIAVPLVGNLAKIERCIIQEVVQRCRGNKAAAARALGLHRRTLYRMLRGEASQVESDESREDR